MKNKTKKKPEEKLVKVEVSLSETFKQEADMVNESLYQEILALISKSASRGGYRVEWRLPWRRRRYRIPQEMKARLQADGFRVHEILNLRNNTAIGLIIVWGVS